MGFPVRSGRAALAATAVAGDERAHQAAVVQWARHYEYLAPELAGLVAIPNAGRRPRRGQRRGPVSAPATPGLAVGFPDLVLFSPQDDYGGLAIELKAPRVGCDVTAEQLAWLERLARLGYRAAAAWGCDPAKRLIARYLANQVLLEATADIAVDLSGPSGTDRSDVDFWKPASGLAPRLRRT